MRIQFNSGRWTDEEHQGFLRGLEAYGRGSWDAIGIFVPSRSPLQIEAHARQHFVMENELGCPEEVARRAPGGQAPFSCPCPSSSSSSSPSRHGGSSSSSSGGGGGGSLSEPPVVVHLVYGVPAFLLEGICDAVAIGVLDELMPIIADDEAYAHQQHQHQHQHQQQHQQQQYHHQQQASMRGEGYRAEEPIGNLVARGIPYPHRLVWEEPALGRELRSCFALDDFGGVL